MCFDLTGSTRRLIDLAAKFPNYLSIIEAIVECIYLVAAVPSVR